MNNMNTMIAFRLAVEDEPRYDTIASHLRKNLGVKNKSDHARLIFKRGLEAIEQNGIYPVSHPLKGKNKITK